MDRRRWWGLEGGPCGVGTAALIGPDGNLVGQYHKHRPGHEVDRHTLG